MKFNRKIVEDFRIERLKDIKDDAQKQAEFMAEQFCNTEIKELRYALATEYIAQINTVLEIEKEIKEKESKDKKEKEE